MPITNRLIYFLEYQLSAVRTRRKSTLENIQETDSESFAVLEMPLGLKSIRMDVAELRRFCKEYRLPVFCLDVGEEVMGAAVFPLKSPWRKWFTLKWDWCLWAAEKIDQQGVKV